MAKKGKQKEPTRTRAQDVQPSTASPELNPHVRTSPASKNASVTPRGGTPGLSSPLLTSPKSGQQSFTSEQQHADAWEEHGEAYVQRAWDQPTGSHEADDDEGWQENEDAQTADEWEAASVKRAHSPATGTHSPVPGGWSQPQEQETHGGWAGGFTSAITSAFGMGSHSQAQTQSEPATAAAGVTRKSTLKKKPPAAHAAPAAAQPASKRVAFSTYSSSLGVRSTSPPLLPSSDPALLSKPETAKSMRPRSQSQSAFAAGWGAPERMPTAPGFSNMQPSHATPGAGSWMQWGNEAAANEEARKRGVTRFAATIKANVPTAPPPQPMPASYPSRSTPAAMYAGGPVAPNITNLQSQLHSILGGGQAHHASQPHADAMHRRQASLPIHVGQQPSPSWIHSAKAYQAQPQRPQQIQPANSWGNTEWAGQSTSGWDPPADPGGGWSPAVDTQDWTSKAGGGWVNPVDDGGGQESQNGAYESWENGKDVRKDKKSRKHGRSNSTTNNNGWDLADTGGYDNGGWETSRGRKASTSNGHGGWANDWDPIPEEDEGEEEEDYDDLDDMYTDPSDQDGHTGRKPTHSGISYQYQSPSEHPTWGGGGAYFPGAQDGRGTANGTTLLPNADSSKTMNFAAGRMTTVFELSPPRQGLGENAFIWSNGAALEHAQRALYSRRRYAKERIYWAFNPQNDPRVASLMRWIEAMSNGLATIGLTKFLETGQRGALITNADYRTNASPGAPTQPAFDWITLPNLRLTCDRIFQESVVTYKPQLQVVVFVFLLSVSGNSMAVWRRKVPIPEGVRVANKDAIAHVMSTLPQDKVVYVDEVVLQEPPSEPPKKKKRGFWKRLFGRK